MGVQSLTVTMFGISPLLASHLTGPILRVSSRYLSLHNSSGESKGNWLEVQRRFLLPSRPPGGGG